MRRFLTGLGILGVVGGVVVAVAWKSAPRAEVVAVDAAAAEAARASGGAAAALRVDREGLSATTLTEARALWDDAELTAARTALEAALASGAGAEDEGALHALLAVVCRRQRDADAAVEHGRRAAELLPTSSAAHHVYARAIAESMRTGGMFAAMRNASPWREELRTAIELDPSNVEARLEELLFYAFVPKTFGGDSGRADELLAELDEHDPVRAKALGARVLQHRKDLVGAAAALDAALEEHPDDPELLLARGDVRVAQEEYARADEDYARAAESRPAETAWRALYQRASARLDRSDPEGRGPHAGYSNGGYSNGGDSNGGDVEQALGWLEEYAREAPRGDYLPGPAQVGLARARALARLGRLEDAAAAFAAALATDEQADRGDRVAKELRAAGVILGG